MPNVISSFAIILMKKRDLVARKRDLVAFIGFLMSCYCLCSVVLPHGAVVGLMCAIVVFPDHTHLLFCILLSHFGCFITVS